MIRELYQAQERGQKAIPYRVELTDAGGPLMYGGAPASYNDYNGFNSVGNVSGRSPMTQREARVHMQTYGGTEAIDWLMDAVNYTAQAASAAEWEFDDHGQTLAVQKEPDDPPGTQVAPQTLIDLFKKPNPHMYWEDLCELTLIDWLLVGNAYWVKWPLGATKQPLALYRMAPQYVKIVPGQFGPEKYLYRLPGENTDTKFDPEQVVHIKRPNPHDPYYGLGLVQGAARPLDMEIELTKTASSYYEKQALPSGVVQTERRVPRDVFNKLKQQIRSFYARSHNAGSLMVLEAGLQYKPISPTAQEALFATMGGWSRDRILALFNMNKSLIGIWEQGDNPNLGMWQTLFDQKTMIPITKKLARAISHSVTQPGWGIDFCINYEATQQPDDVLNRAGTVAKLPGIMVHEVRAAANLPPSTGDETIDKTVLNLPQPNMGPNGTGGAADPNLPHESGNPPLPENTTQFQRRTGKNRAPAARAGGKSGAVAGKKSLDDILADIDNRLDEIKALPPAAHVHVGKLSGNHVTPPQDVLFDKRTGALDPAISDLQRELQAAAAQLERGLMDAAEGKAEGTIYQRVKNSKAWKAFTDRVTTALDNTARDALSMSNVHHTGQGLDAAEIDYEAEAKTVIHRRNGGVSSIFKTIKKMILDSVLSGQRKGDTNANIQAALQAQIATWVSNNAVQVAADTVTSAYNEGTLHVAEQNGATDVLVSDGMDFDQPCIDANGETWPLAKARDNLQQHSRCRRAFVPVLS